MNEDRIMLEFDDGVKLEAEVMGVFEVKGVEYVALTDPKSDEVYLYRYTSDGKSFELSDIPDGEFDMVSKEFDAIMAAMEK